MWNGLKRGKGTGRLSLCFYMKDRYMKKISANVLLLGIVSFLNDFSSEMIMPILPMFITALGGTGLAVGLIGGLRDSISSILKVFCGYWSDKKGKRKSFVFSGYLVSGIFKLLLSFSKIWQNVLVLSSLERVGKGVRTAPRDAIIADSMPEERGRGFGIHRAFDTAGAIFGSLTAFILFWFFRLDFKSIIFLAALLAGLSLIPVSFVKDEERKQKDITFKLSIGILPNSLKLFILISGVFALANFSYMFLILKAGGLFAGRRSVGMVILLYILFNIFYALFSVPFGKLSDKAGRGKVIVSGYFLFSAVCFGFVFFKSLTAIIILFALYGLVQAMIDANQRAFVSDLSPEGIRATGLGVFHTVIGLAALPASLIAGLLWQKSSSSSVFIYGGIMSAISVVMFLVFSRHFKNSKAFKLRQM